MALLRGWKEGDVPKGIKCLVGGVITSSSPQGQELNTTLLILFMRTPRNVNHSCLLVLLGWALQQWVPVSHW